MAVKTDARPGRPWVDWPIPQSKKTAIKQVAKYLPLAPDMALALKVDGESEADIPQYTDDVKPPAQNKADEIIAGVYRQIDAINTSEDCANAHKIIEKMSRQPFVDSELIDDMTARVLAKQNLLQ